MSRKYGDQVKVVFDGYNNEPSTKNMTQLMRSAGKTSVTVTFTDGMTITMKKGSFLSNAENKRHFIAMLRQYLTDDGCDTLQAVGDADVLIVKTAVASAATHPTALVGDDTDLLVLLCYYVKAGDHDVFFRPEPKLNAKERRVWNIKVMKEELGKKNLPTHTLPACRYRIGYNHLTCLVSGKLRRSRNSSLPTFKTKPNFSTAKW